MIIESTMDYGTGVVTIVYDNCEPTAHAVNSHCEHNYGFVPTEYTVDAPNDYKGLLNPGIITCRKEA